MKKNPVQITASTKLTMIFCACIVGVAVLLFTFLVFFPIKVDNPKNGINEKLIAAATTAEPVETAPMETTVPDVGTSDETTTETSFSFTRRTTDKERGYTGTTTTRTIWQEPEWNYNNEYNNNQNNYNPVVTYPVVPGTTAPPVYTDTPSTDAPVIDTDTPVTDAPVVTDAPPAETNAPAPAVTDAPAPVVTDAPAPVVTDAPAE
ncbi:MAG: hypothetical protein IJ512_08155 [Ruminococcus sp.]|nr:hypothetical protein [Ruminococcus sp.]